MKHDLAKETQRAHAAEHLVEQLREEIRILLERLEREKKEIENNYREQIDEFEKLKKEHAELLTKFAELQA